MPVDLEPRLDDAVERQADGVSCRSAELELVAHEADQLADNHPLRPV
jgi:hypothetical protein